TVIEYDTKSNRGETVKEFTLEVLSKHRATQKELKTDSSTIFGDFSFALTLFPRYNDILGIVFTHHHPFREDWFNLPFVKEYGYWNNVDKPDNVSEYKWRQRYKDWDNAFGFCVPSEKGLTRTLVNRVEYSFLPMENEIKKHIPTIN